MGNSTDMALSLAELCAMVWGWDQTRAYAAAAIYWTKHWRTADWEIWQRVDACHRSALGVKRTLCASWSADRYEVYDERQFAGWVRAVRRRFVAGVDVIDAGNDVTE